jgi:transcription antitermination protein NusB
MMSPNRRKARELALQALYACDQQGSSERLSVLAEIAEEAKKSGETLSYARDLVEKTGNAQAQIDEALARNTANWDVKRINAIDRNILRMAVAELMFCPEVPFKVVIDEAVEIAKRFGTDDSGKFVNGILDSIYNKEIAATRKT